MIILKGATNMQYINTDEPLINAHEDTITSGLNPMQKEAVISADQYILVLAGAGSGKTRVLVHRINWLLSVENCFPNSILAVTFTNKAAQEMKARVAEKCQIDLYKMWVGTFHGLSHKMLRIHHSEANLPEDFIIIDSDDQYKLIRKIAKANNIDEKQFPIKSIQSFINSNKDKAIRANDVQEQDNIEHSIMSRVYKLYEKKLNSENLLDFSELLLRSYELLKNNDDLRLYYQGKFKHILVDEFQDTNPLQYNWIKLLMSSETKLMTVGDDDQSIYTWRGACIENILDIQKDFPDVKVIRLEQNYRSSKNILDAANTLIQNNQSRWGKSLWTEQSKGEPIMLYEGFNATAEAQFIAKNISIQSQKHKIKIDQIGVLYRTNAQSRVIEEALMQAGIPYKIYGGLKFFERAEIKNILSYLRLSANPNDDHALARIVNIPARGIGAKTWEGILEYANNADISLWKSCNTLAPRLPSKAQGGMLKLINNIKNWNNLTSPQNKPDTKFESLGDLAQLILEDTNLIGMYQKETKEQAQNKIENLNEFISACNQFQSAYLSEFKDDIKIPLDQIRQQFLAYAVLDSERPEKQDNEPKVQLMTIHAAKGLEFPIVFCAGLEENLFPAYWNQNDEKQLEEERRLCYVAITRAKMQLILSYAKMRDQYGQTHTQKPSRFIKELSIENMDLISDYAKIKRPRLARQIKNTNNSRSDDMTDPETCVTTEQMFKNQEILDEVPFKAGDRIRHPRFGEGTVNQLFGDEQIKVEVEFDTEGPKTLILKYARLESI